jgi:hypothetical protein
MRRMNESSDKQEGQREMAKEPKPRRKGSTPGPKPQLLKITGNWERAVTKSFKKKKPPEGWPK